MAKRIRKNNDYDVESPRESKGKLTELALAFEAVASHQAALYHRELKDSRALELFAGFQGC